MRLPGASPQWCAIESVVPRIKHIVHNRQVGCTARANCAITVTLNNHPRFPHLFRPYDLKGVELRNRVAISGHFAGWWVDQGLPSDAFVAYVEERAKGGVCLFTIGATSPEPGSGCMQNLDDAIIPRYR